MRNGDELELEISRLTAGGEGLGLAEGRAIEVVGAFPGERVRARLEALSRHHPRGHAALLSVIEAHPARREAPCPRHRTREGGCTGCPLMTLGVEAQRALKTTRARSLAGLENALPAEGGAAQGYRFSAKRVVGGRPGRLVLGSYVRRTHRVTSMHGCLVDHPRLVAVADEIWRVGNELRIEPYRDGKGDLRYVWLATDGTRVLVTLVTAAEQSRAPDLAAALRLADSIAWSVQPSSGNAVRGRAPRTLVGSGVIHPRLAGREASVGPLDFLQPNPAMAGRAYVALVGDARGQSAWDLYAGAGVTTGLLRERFEVVIPCELYPGSAAALGVEPEAAEAFLARQTSSPDLVTANPPRKGMGAKVCEALVRLGPPAIHIMSCNPETLASDLARLDASYRVDFLSLYDTLPHTAHVEAVARLSRRESAADGTGSSP